MTAHKIGYIMGAGDDMPDALRQLGLDVTLLSQSDLEQGDLSRFDAIVAGVRAYNVRPDVRANQPRLLEYVRNGGTYVVQYQSGEGGRGGPGDRTRQHSAIEYRPVPDHDSRRQRVPRDGGRGAGDVPASRQPAARRSRTGSRRKISKAGCRSAASYSPRKWDPQYQTVLSSGDPGEKPLEGGELWTRYGKGVYIFTSYSWFRQLPAGVPGAYRLFANLLSAK